MIPQTVGFARRIADGVARRLNTLERKVNPALTRSSHNESVVSTMNDYDMVTQPDEPFYAQQYLRFITPELERRFPQRRIHLVDLGCGQGRLSLPLAQWCAKGGGTVTGVDLTPAAVAKAQSYSLQQGITNATFVARDAVEYAREMADASADAVVFTEVTFFMPSYREVVKELRRVLKPGGVAFIAFRSQYYNMLQLVLIRSWDDAKRCLTERAGHIFGGPVGFAWHTVDDVHRELKEDGLRVLRLLGIGICSGIKGDARATIVHPAQLSPQDQKKLMDLECAAAEQYAACGRYILTIAERT